MSLLLSPLEVGGRQLKNRVVSTAHGWGFDWFQPENSGDRYIAYQERRAAGGAALMILQNPGVVPVDSLDGPYQLDYFRDRFRRLADAVHRHGAVVLQQVGHVGAQFRAETFDPDLKPLWSFSGTTSPEGDVSHEMTPDDIERILNGFVRLGALAVDSGLDGIELHGAHGYLIQQSYSRWANRRTDRWGDPGAFVGELLTRLRTVLGREPIIGLRMCLDDWRPADEGGMGTEELCSLAATFAARGAIDLLNHSEGSMHHHYARSIGTWRVPHGAYLPLTRSLKEAVPEVPVIGVGRIVTPDEAERALADGICDLVGMTRALIADPDLVRKVELGQRDRVRPCVGSNQGCQDRITQKLPITCFHNPDVGREATMALIASPHPRDVLVVGAGPAGLKAAEIAARRGHRVQVVDRAPRIGGRLRVVEALPGASELLGSVRWVERELRELGVDVQLGVEADEALVDALGPEVVVVATGASPDPAALLREADRPGVPLISADEAMTAPLADARVLVVDQLGGFEAAFAAERLALAGARVAVCTPYPSPGQFMGMTSAVAHIEVLARHGCDVHAHSMFRGIDGSEATVHHELTGRTTVVEVDAVVTAVAPLPNVALAEALRGTDRDVLLAGDVVAPRTAMHAFREGDAVARLI